MRLKIYIWLSIMVTLLVFFGCGDDPVVPQEIGPTNHAPIISAIPETTMAVGDTLKVWLKANDIDGDSLKYKYTIICNSLWEIKTIYRTDSDIDSLSGYFWFRPRTDDRPRRRFLMRVYDGNGGADTTNLIVYVP